MSRARNESALSSASSAGASSAIKSKYSELPAWIGRAGFIAAFTALSFAWRPFALTAWVAGAAGFASAVVLVLAELVLRRVDGPKLLGGITGLILGTFTSFFVCLVISRTAEPEPAKSFLELASLFGFAYLGLSLGTQMGWPLETGRITSVEKPANGVAKLLDTSVLIDGRIADICEAQFLDGPLQVPRFVLHELQQIADSSDSLRRQRGRRGLEVLQRIQKMPHMNVVVLEEDARNELDVDRKLIELARSTGAKIVTNDFNLNKVASVQGISVLNVNQLANALRPAVLPGEPMRVFIMREGKEANQGVAYLEDGTMVVVDGARRFQNRNIEITVTSVHQTPAGKMIFGRLLEEKAEQPVAFAKQAAVGRGEAGGKIPKTAPQEPGLRKETLDPKQGFD